MKGLFITLEGIDGCGKSTQASLLADRIKELGCKVVHTFEPGGTELGRLVRSLFLQKDAALDARTELFLMAADRSHHVAKVIRPALKRGAVVVCERYVDSSVAYQGYGGDIPVEDVLQVNELATQGLEPHITFLLDIDPKEVANRRARADDRMEAREADFHQRVRQGYLQLAKKYPRRIVKIDVAGQSIKQTQKAIQSRLMESELLAGWRVS